MKKKAFSILLTGVLAASLLSGCGGSSSGGSSSAAAPAAESTAAPAAESTAAPADTTDYGSGEIKVWVADGVTDFTKQQISAFQEAHPEFSGYTFTVESVGEGDVASNMITDVEGGADVFGFAQDQLARLVSAGALTPAGDDSAWITEQNDAGAVAAATMADTIFAYPVTSDNGYFLYYDKSVVTDPSTLEGIIADCEKAGKGFYMEINSGWYQTAFFFGTGCHLQYETNDDGTFASADVTYASQEGVDALKAIINLHKSPIFYNGSSVSNAANCAAIVDGTWDAEAAKSLFGDNYATAKLPTFKAGGKDVQMSGFGGFKLLGVKPQTDAGKLAVCRAFAKYLTSAEVQEARFEAVGWGPSNKTAQASDAVQADPALSALSEQLAFTIPQGQYPDEYWKSATSLGDSIISGDYDNASDEELMAALTSFQETCVGLVK